MQMLENVTLWSASSKKWKQLINILINGQRLHQGHVFSKHLKINCLFNNELQIEILIYFALNSIGMSSGQHQSIIEQPIQTFRVMKRSERNQLNWKTAGKSLRSYLTLTMNNMLKRLKVIFVIQYNLQNLFRLLFD